MPKFGNFPSFEAFIANYEAETQKKEKLSLAELSFETKIERARQPRERNVVDVDCVIKSVLPDEDTIPQHYHLHVQVTAVRLHDQDVEADVSRCVTNNELIFVAIRHGDRMGIQGEIPGLKEGIPIELKGEWIPRELAYSHGGEKMSVLHFTHHDIGFVSVNGEIYS